MIEKNKIIAFASVLVIFFLFSCDEDSHIYTGPNYVEFPISETTTTLEYNFMGTELVQIKTQMIGAQQQEDKMMGFEMVTDNTTAEEGTDFNFVTNGQYAFPANSSFGYIELNAIGSGLNPGESVSIELSLVDGDLPVSPNYQVATHTITKSARPEVSFSGTELEAKESDASSLEVEIALDKPAVTDLSVSFEVSGTAVEGEDFEFSDTMENPFTIVAGETSYTFDINVLDDMVVEDESITIEITDVTPTTNDENDAVEFGGSFTINIDDETKLITHAQESLTLVKDNVGVNIFPVTLVSTSTEPVTVSYTISGGVQGTDYNDLTNGILVFEPGQLVKNIDFQLLEDAFGGSDFDVEITLMSVVSDDGEVSLSESTMLVLSIAN